MFVFILTDLGATKFGDYIFPQWADSLGWMMGASTLAPFVVFVAMHLIRKPKVLISVIEDNNLQINPFA